MSSQGKLDVRKKQVGRLALKWRIVRTQERQYCTGRAAPWSQRSTKIKDTSSHSVRNTRGFSFQFLTEIQGNPSHFFLFLKNKFIYFYFWLRWVFVAARGLSSERGLLFVVVPGLLIGWLLLLQSTGSRRGLQQLWHSGSVVVAHRLSCFAACGIFPDQGSNPCPLH